MFSLQVVSWMISLTRKTNEKTNKQRIAIQQGSAGANGHTGMHTAMALNGALRAVNDEKKKTKSFSIVI